MRWFFDTEFNEDGRTIELISIALVSSDRNVRPLYYVSSEFKEFNCNDWVKANVLPHLPPRGLWRTREQIRNEVARVLRTDDVAKEKPEIWAYFSAYDWVVFCQLFGRNGGPAAVDAHVVSRPEAVDGRSRRAQG
jgi:hypothetical protein